MTSYNMKAHNTKKYSYQRVLSGMYPI